MRVTFRGDRDLDISEKYFVFHPNKDIIEVVSRAATDASPPLLRIEQGGHRSLALFGDYLYVADSPIDDDPAMLARYALAAGGAVDKRVSLGRPGDHPLTVRATQYEVVVLTQTDDTRALSVYCAETLDKVWSSGTVD